MLASVGKLLYYFLPCLIVVYLNVLFMQVIETFTTVTMGMKCRPMFVEVVFVVTYRLIIVANHRTFYTSISPKSRPLPSFMEKVKGCFHKISSTVQPVLEKYASQQVAKITSFVEKILNKPGDNRHKYHRSRNYGKKRRKQSSRHSYKLRTSYTQTSTTEYSRSSSKNEGAPNNYQSTIQRLVTRFMSVLVFKKGRSKYQMHLQAH